MRQTWVVCCCLFLLFESMEAFVSQLPCVVGATRERRSGAAPGQPMPIPVPKTLATARAMTKDDDGKTDKNAFFSKPGNLIALPFIAILGFDLILNIGVLTKRTLELVLLGQAPSTEPWW